MLDTWLEDRIAMTKKDGLAALAGAALVAVGFSPKRMEYMVPLIVIGAIMLVRFFIHETISTIWHWKRRYRGEHSDLCGALLVLETSGWFKIVYWFRHILLAWRGTSRYSDHLSAETDIGKPGF
jgi:hypothetical protein